MYLNKFLTDYDESLSSDLNIDQLGQLVIWSAWGQQIFHNSISSVANDVRHYTLNLLHHYIVKSVVDDDTLQLSQLLKKRYSFKDELHFKTALLIHLENIYTFSMLEAQSKNVVTTGVLGIIKARQKWNDESENPRIIFGHGAECQLLINQMSLGTNGRYKTPMMNLKFFDRQYRYDRQEAQAVWLRAKAFIEKEPKLRKVSREALAWLRSLLTQNHKKSLNIPFREIPDALCNAYVKAFPSSPAVGEYAKDFWLEMTQLNQGAAGMLYQVLEKTNSEEALPEVIFARASQHAAKKLPEDECQKLNNIVQAEPFLALINLLFNAMLRQKKQTLAEVATFWRGQGLNARTLPAKAAQLRQIPQLMASLTGTPKNRFEALLDVASAKTLEGQAAALLDYHAGLMTARGQIPWVMLNDRRLEVHIPPRPFKEAQNYPHWVNNYYLPQFKYMIAGLRGTAA